MQNKMQVISGDKFAALNGVGNIIYREWDWVHESNELHKSEGIVRHHGYFNEHLMPKEPFILVTHQGDPAITYEHKWLLDNPNLIHWYATNAALIHPKLTCIPVGIEYRLPKTAEAIFNEVMAMDIPKTKDIYCNFKIHEWVEERARCKQAMDRNGMIMDERIEYRDYLIALKQSRFCLSPIGNGVECFRVWECLYLDVIPVLTAYINKERVRLVQYQQWLYDQFPKVIIDSWEAFDKSKFTKELYDETFFKSQILDFNFWKFLILSTK